MVLAGQWNRILRAAAFSSLAALLLVACPGGAFAQTVAQDQYVTQDQYSDGGAQQAPVGPEDQAYPGLKTPAPTSAPPGGALGQSSAAAQDQYSGSGTTGSAPSSVPPAGPSRAPEVAQEDPSSPGPVNPGSQGAGSSQVPVGPSDPAHPGLAAQAPQQTLGQTLTDVSAELGGIGQSIAALGQGAAPEDAQTPAATSDAYPAAVPAFSAPTTAVVGGDSSGQPPVAAVDPYSAAMNAVSAVGAGAPGYTTTSGQAHPSVAVLGGDPQGQQADVAVLDPYAAAVSAASPSVPSSTQQTTQYLAQHLQQLLWAKQAADYQAQQQQLQLQPYLDRLAQLLAVAAPPTGQVGLANVTSGNSLSPAEYAPESNCVNVRTWLLPSEPDGSDADGFSDMDDVYENCDAAHPDAFKLFPQWDPL